MLRAAVAEGTSLGRKAQSIMESGELVPDDLIIDLVRVRTTEPDCARGYLFDGFPRTIPQAKAMKHSGLGVDCVVEIAVDEDEIVRRMSGRRTHLPSGRTYHVAYNPPKVSGIDDVTGEPLVQRDDDREETVRHRLGVYHRQTRPLVDFYSTWANSADPRAPRFVRINGIGEVAEVKRRALAAIDGRDDAARERAR